MKLVNLKKQKIKKLIVYDIKIKEDCEHLINNKLPSLRKKIKKGILIE